MFLKKISFNYPKKNKFLFYDYLSRFKIIIKTDYEKIDFRNEINFFVLFLSIFFLFKNNFSLKLSYIFSYILIVRPKKIFTFTDNDLLFYQLKKKFFDIEFISIQNGTRSISGDMFSFKKSNTGYQCDKILVHNGFISQKYNEIIKSNIVIAGSVLNNFLKKKKHNKKLFDITFISQFENKDNFSFHNYLKENISWKKYYSAELKILKILKKFSDKNDISINICARFRNDNKSEFDFYKNIFGEKFTFSVPNENLNQYDICDSSNLVIFLDSTLGYESISRDNKTLGFSIRGEIINDKSYSFGWPKKISTSGPSWISYYDQNKIEEMLNYNFNLDYDEWNNINGAYIKNLMEIKENSLLDKDLFK